MVRSGAWRSVRARVARPGEPRRAPPGAAWQGDQVSDAPAAVYTHGHHESVLRSHNWRTADNSAAYLLDHLAPGMEVLDVGCGPGTITADLASLVAPGRVVGVDAAPAIVEAAARDHGGDTVAFEVGDVGRLRFDDDSFDVVHAHQVLQHLGDPVAALVEMARVCRPGGLVAARDADYGAMTWFPPDPDLDRWNDLYHRLAIANGGEPDAGRRLVTWARAAGFTDVVATASVWCFADDGDRAWWGGLWAVRVTSSAFADQAREHGLTDDAELAVLADAWRRWASADGAWFAVLHGEVRCRV